MADRLQFVFNRREEKFPLDANLWRRVIGCAERYLPTERFDGVHSLVNIRTTYLDTIDLHSYREYVEARPVRKKIRIRQYGYDGNFNGTCWVEVKIKRYQESLKRRFCCTGNAVGDFFAGQDIHGEVARLNAGHPDATEVYRAASALVADRDLRPVVRVDYERMSFQADGSPGGRITVDRNIRFRRPRQADTASFAGTILEVKYPGSEPEWMGALLQDLSLLGPSRFSKFARAVRELGVAVRETRA